MIEKLLDEPTIASRYYFNEDFSTFVRLRVGMIITTRTNENNEPIVINSRPTLPFPDFSYVVLGIDSKTISLVDTSHNNEWSIKVKELDSCELVGDFHRNNQVDSEFVNRALSND